MSHVPKTLLAAAFTSLMLLASCADDDDVAPPGEDSTAGEDELSPEEIAEQERAEEEARIQEQVQELTQQREAALAGPSQEHETEAEELVGQMSLEQRAGQVLIGEYQGTDVSSAAQLIEDYHLAGMILMGHNIPGGTSSVETEALASQVETISAAGAEGRAVPPIISLDQEGGLVTRVGAPVTEWPTPMGYGAAGDTELSLHGHRLMAEDLRELGFTVSFAPNADVTMGAADPTIGSRSFGADPEAVSAHALAGIRGLAEGGLAGSVKHFPGHGSVSEDSHYTLPVQNQSLEELRARDWLPFAASAEAGVPMVMMGHIEVPALDPGVPSSLSDAAYQEIRDMGHDGVIVTDAMNMAAIVNTYGGDQAAVQALTAGADLLLMPASVPGAHNGIVSAVESGELPEERLVQAAERVVALALWQQDLAAGELEAGPGVERPEILEEDSAETLAEYDADQMALEVSLRALTVVHGGCPPSPVEAIQIHGGTETDRARLAAAAQSEGIEVGWGSVVTLLGGSTPGTGDVVVALDRPEALADSTAETKIALYGRTPESYAVLAEILAGGGSAEGTLPVTVGDHAPGYSACE